MRTVLFVLASLLILTSSGPSADKPKANPADKPKADPSNKLMVEKLKNSQTLLEGLTMNDFDKIKGSAEELIRISKAAEWSAYKTPMYEVHTNNFRRAAETIVQKAKDKNIEGATLAYVEMTVTCVRCHQHTREIRDTSWSPREE
jgi:hypothetical protein